MDALTQKELDEIESILGLPLPADVREQYLVSNGLLGPTDCQLLYPYKKSESNDIIHANTIRSESWFPATFSSTVLLGNDGCGSNVCYNWQTKEAILWSAADGEEIQEWRATVKEIRAYIEDFYASVP